MITIAIDPGAKGGICFTGATPGTVEAYKMPATPKDACDIITTAKEIAEMNNLPIRCVMEQVGGYIGVAQPGSSAFNFGRGFGNLEGFLICLGIPFELVPPQRWQKAVGLNFPPVHKGDYAGMSAPPTAIERKRVASLNAKRKRDNKTMIKEMAQRLYPKLKVTLETADALMILQYALKTP